MFYKNEEKYYSDNLIKEYIIKLYDEAEEINKIKEDIK
jgi:hypothetical protein